jgi:hypothetical protein
MSTIELEAQKAGLAREILCMEDENMINNMWLMLKNNLSFYQQENPQKREIGFLEGTVKVTFHDNWEMTPEELFGL